MQSKAKISVIIPTYNRAADLVKAVTSARKQTLLPLEILVCDDGSSDNSKQLIEQLNDPLVKWIDCGKNGGPAIPRNIGIKQSKGEWLAFLDSDDEWLPKKLELQMNAIDSCGGLAACSDAFRIRNGKNEGSYLNAVFSKIDFEELLKGNQVICSSALVNKKLIIDTSVFPPEKKFVAIEDYALWMRLSLRTDFVFVNECLLNYNDSSSTSIRSKYTEQWTIFEIIFSDLKKWVRKNKVKIGDERKKMLNEFLKRSERRGEPPKMEVLKDKFKGTVVSILKGRKNK